MRRVAKIAVWSAAGLLSAVALAQAGIPRGAILSADEQDADAATGITIAHGNAEIKIEKMSILGRAQSIELNPVSNQNSIQGRRRVDGWARAL